MAILALLARAGERGVTREKVRSLLWPDADEDRGSRTLSQALYALRKDLLAEDAITGAKELRFDPALVTTDVTEFAAAVSRGDDARAANLYAGPFLDGFHVSGAEEFTRWVERERSILAQQYVQSLESLARRALADGKADQAVTWWRKLAAVEPLNARVTIGLMEALAAAGDRATAINQARIYELLIEQELELPPDAEVLAFAERLRVQPDDPPKVAVPADRSKVSAPADEPVFDEPSAIGDKPSAVSHQPSAVAPPATIGTLTPGRALRFSWRSLAVGSAIVAVAAAGLSAARWLAGRPGTPNESTGVVAIGRIASYGTDSSTRALAGPVADLLATSLARSSRLRVVSPARMLELMRRPEAPNDTGAAGFIDAARRAGATEVIDGTLYTRPGGLRLDLRRVDLQTGAIAGVHSVEGDDFFALVDSGTSQIVAIHGGTAPAGSIAGVTTRSVAAYSLYVEGMKMLADGDVTGAERLFGAALREDSTFAMAAYQYGRSGTLRVPIISRMRQALRLSAHATDRERLMIRAGWATMVTSHDLVAIADTLMARYPQETESHFYLGRARMMDGEYLKAIEPLQRVVAMDSLSFTRTDDAAGCNACAAMEQIVSAYHLADSLEAAEREARRWTRLQPKVAASWIALWDVLERAGKFTEASKLTDHIASLDRDPVAAMARASTHALRTGDLTTGERVVRVALQAGNATAQREAMWQLILNLRYQGRLTEAEAVARRYRTIATPLDSGAAGVVTSSAAPLASVLYEAGRYREAAALFDSISHWHAPDDAPTGIARERTWRLTMAARSLAAAGDTAAVVRLADTIAKVGALSGHVRDRRLGRYVRGLVLLARHDLQGAEAELRASVFSWPAGFTRTNCDLALVLLRLGRPRDAIAALQPALRGKVDASNFYVTHTEVHELLAQAWDALGVADSAAVHRAWVARARSRPTSPQR